MPKQTIRRRTAPSKARKDAQAKAKKNAKVARKGEVTPTEALERLQKVAEKRSYPDAWVEVTTHWDVDGEHVKNAIGFGRDRRTAARLVDLVEIAEQHG